MKLKTSTYNHPFTLTTEWAYDSWNRVKRIIYPDNEKVTYSYNLGGLLKHVEGDKPSIGTTIYINDITYDEYEQRTSVINGNQTQTYYTYDSVMRRMTHLNTINPNGDLLRLEYSYDYAGNITKIENTGLNPYLQTYRYDDIYQLEYAEGNWTDNNTPIDYRLNMSYSPSGRIENKGLRGHRIDNQGTYMLDYDNKYTYGANSNPYALKHIIDNNTGDEHYFDWDQKGNMIFHDDKKQGNPRKLCWTEDNRLQAVKDNNMGSYYNYDAQGERNLKLTGGTMQMIQNGQTMYVPVLDQQTLYANALVTVNDKGYTKHYFEEGKRICSKIGSGELWEIDNLIDISDGGLMMLSSSEEPAPEPDELTRMYEEIRDKQVEGIIKTYDMCMSITPYINNGNLYEDIIKKYENQVNSGEPIFYYHSDHLGSASFLTDETGAETQQLVYLPFGEDWVDKKYNTSQYDTPYKFNGKEKDPETGYNNYGARYYYDWASIWLSVDPMSDKYPHLTSYNYCANNPIMLIDPDGRDIDPASESDPYIQEQVQKNAAFAKQYNELAGDKSAVYSFNRMKEPIKKNDNDYTYGYLGCKGKNENGQALVTINYTVGEYNNDDLLRTNKNFSLYEETAHAGQFSNGDLGFGTEDGGKTWIGSLGLDITDEVNAKNWASKALKMDPYYNESNLDGNYEGISLVKRTAEGHHRDISKKIGVTPKIDYDNNDAFKWGNNNYIYKKPKNSN